MKLQIFEVISVVVLKCHVVRILFPGKPNVHIRSVYFDHDDGRILPRKKILVYSTTGLIATAGNFDNKVTGTKIQTLFFVN